MSLIVQKYGGTSLGNIKKIKKVCSLISEEHKKNNQVVVIASAMAGDTNKLINFTKEFDVRGNSAARNKRP